MKVISRASGFAVGGRLQVIVGILVLVFTITYHLSPTTSLAHFVKSDGTVGTLLHIDPEDDPVAGSPSNIIFEFKDTDNQFDLDNCDCKLLISKNGQELTSLPLTPVSESEKLSSLTPFTFPEKNIYNVKITGSPKGNAQFSNFEINYDVRVARETEPGNSTTEKSPWLSEHLVHLIGGAIIVIFFIAALIIQNKRKVAVIILIGLLLSHFVPVKAIHASHSGHFDSTNLTCCLPVNALTPSLPVLPPPSFNLLNNEEPVQIVVYPVSVSSFFTRSPPF
jgi:hypothetical protein